MADSQPTRAEDELTEAVKYATAISLGRVRSELEQLKDLLSRSGRPEKHSGSCWENNPDDS